MIMHLVPAANWGDEAAGENRILTLVMAGDGGMLSVVTFLKASSMQSLLTSLVLLRGKP
jgi:hypothetical protein